MIWVFPGVFPPLVQASRLYQYKYTIFNKISCLKRQLVKCFVFVTSRRLALAGATPPMRASRSYQCKYNLLINKLPKRQLDKYFVSHEPEARTSGVLMLLIII
ncbi:hypothetical protein CMT87_15285 [Elizabethkingia anophelis]|nr:hypothetical protein CWH99_03155 [Elizabethkingia anophelis]PKR35015.1 hypothetical protein CWI00_10145 [Elizabethkingia anophelis]PRQ81487.1 hypothetical protein CMT60_05365 [Elizabethkingia anophelis]PRQ82137.1 hypothetical protein CMT87_15285 [Elizabethkingia anophelis]PRQ89353.1 hypothetical protein CMT86_02705 [Elizabethkingia anophelis]